MEKEFSVLLDSIVLVRFVLMRAHHQVDFVDWGLDQNLLVIERKYLNEVPDPVCEIQV